MTQSNWIGQVKNAVDVATMASSYLGLDEAFGDVSPCPACNSSRRSRSDSRHPIGITNDGGGWKCHACGASGDSLDLAAYQLVGRKTSEFSKEDWEELRGWAEGRGLIGSPDNRPAPMVRAKKKPKPQRAPVDTTGPFRWGPQRHVVLSESLWGDTAEAKAARDYLTVTRRLSEQTLRDFHIGLLAEDDGRPIRSKGRPVIVIPLMDEHGRVVNLKFRSVPTPGTCDNEECDPELGCKKCRDYRNCKGRDLPLFGAHLLSSRYDKPVILVEGEFDLLSIYEYGFTENVAATTSGAGAFMDEWLDLLEPYNNIIGMYDPDKVGQEGWSKAAEALGKKRCLTATPPKEDVNDCLVHGVPFEDVLRCITRAESMLGITVRHVSDFAEELEILIQNPDVLKGIPLPTDKLQEAWAGIRPGVIAITGETGEGKTTWTTWLLYKLCKSGARGMITSFEQSPIDSVQKLMRIELQDDFLHKTAQERADAYARFPESLWILDHYGDINVERLKQSIEYAKRRHGITLFLVDHIGFVVDDKAESEVKAINKVMRYLATLAKNERITIFLICHPKGTGNNVGAAHGKRVHMRDIKGSSGIRQDAHEAVVVQRGTISDSKPYPHAYIHFDKVRSEFAQAGASVMMAFDPISCCYADSHEELPHHSLFDSEDF